MANFTPVDRILFFTMPCPKVPLSLPAQKRECGIFGPGMVKNSIRSTGVKLASPYLVFAESHGRKKERRKIYMRVKLCHKTVFLRSKVFSCIVWHTEKENPSFRGGPQNFLFGLFRNTFWQKILRIAHKRNKT